MLLAESRESEKRLRLGVCLEVRGATLAAKYYFYVVHGNVKNAGTYWRTGSFTNATEIAVMGVVRFVQEF